MSVRQQSITAGDPLALLTEFLLSSKSLDRGRKEAIQRAITELPAFTKTLT